MADSAAPTQTIQLGKRKLAVSVQGRGPTLLLVHGFPLDHTIWRHQIQHFSKSMQVIAPDLSGFGKSGVDSRATVSMEDYADDLSELIDQLTPPGPLTFCGLSMGGYIGWQFLKRHRPKVDRLVMTNTRSGNDDERTARGRRLAAGQILKHGVSEILSHMPLKLVGSSAPPELVRELRDVITNTPAETVAAAQLAMAERPDMSDFLETLDLPTLLVCGSQDTITPPEEMVEMGHRIEGSTYVEIAGAGHLTPLESPSAFNQALEQFLQIQ